jgi:hypothetical protein
LKPGDLGTSLFHEIPDLASEEQCEALGCRVLDDSCLDAPSELAFSEHKSDEGTRWFFARRIAFFVK